MLETATALLEIAYTWLILLLTATGCVILALVLLGFAIIVLAVAASVIKTIWQDRKEKKAARKAEKKRKQEGRK